MADSSLVKRLGIKPRHRVLVWNAPEGFWEQLGNLPPDVDVKTSPDGHFDVVQVFVLNKADVDQIAAQAVDALKPGGMLWFTYPKKTSKIKTDISRDVGWDAVTRTGNEGIAIISVDDTWSALRFRPTGDIKRRR